MLNDSKNGPAEQCLMALIPFEREDRLNGSDTVIETVGLPRWFHGYSNAGSAERRAEGRPLSLTPRRVPAKRQGWSISALTMYTLSISLLLPLLLVCPHFPDSEGIS